MEDGPVAASVARVGALVRKLGSRSGPNFSVLAQLAAEVEALKALGLESPVEEIVESLRKLVTRPLHDHPKFVDLIAIHVSALKLAATGGRESVGADGGAMLLGELYAATQKIFERKRPG